MKASFILFYFMSNYQSSSPCSSASSSDNESDVDLSTLRPFNFEPEIPAEELGDISSSSASEEEEVLEDLRIGNNTWCSCGGHCKPMQTSAESLCCKDTKEIPDELFDGRIFRALIYTYCKK